MDLFVSSHDYFVPYFGVFANISYQPDRVHFLDTVDGDSVQYSYSSGTVLPFSPDSGSFGFDFLFGPLFRFTNTANLEISVGSGLHAAYSVWKTVLTVDNEKETVTYEGFMFGIVTDFNFKFNAQKKISFNIGVSASYDFFGTLRRTVETSGNTTEGSIGNNFCFRVALIFRAVIISEHQKQLNCYISFCVL